MKYFAANVTIIFKKEDQKNYNKKKQKINAT